MKTKHFDISQSLPTVDRSNILGENILPFVQIPMLLYRSPKGSSHLYYYPPQAAARLDNILIIEAREAVHADSGPR